MKGQLRSSVLTAAAGADPRPAFSGVGGGLSQRLSDAVVEAYLRSSGRSYTHSVFCAEADLSEGCAATDVELCEALGVPENRQRGCLGQLVLQATSRSSPKRADAAMQATHSLSGASQLEHKLASVDDEHRLSVSSLHRKSADEWARRIRAAEADARVAAEAEAREAFERWREGDALQMRADEERKCRQVLDKRLEELAHVERTMRSQLHSEQLKAQQLSREAELKISSLDGEKANTSRLVHIREESLTMLKQDFERLQTEHAVTRERLAAASQAADEAVAEKRALQHALASKEAELSATAADRERFLRITNERVGRIASQTEVAQQRSVISERGTMLASAEVTSLHAQLHAALERVARLEVLQSSVLSPLSGSEKTAMGDSVHALAAQVRVPALRRAPSAARSETDRLDIDSGRDPAKPRSAQLDESGKSADDPAQQVASSGMPPTAHRYQAAGDDTSSANSSTTSVAEADPPSPAARTAANPSQNTTAATRSADTGSDQRSSLESEQTSQIENSTAPERADTSTDVVEVDSSKAVHDPRTGSTHHEEKEDDEVQNQAVGLAQWEDERCSALRAAASEWVREHQALIDGEYDATCTDIAAAMQSEGTARSMALQQQQQRVEQEFREKREAALAIENDEAVAPPAGVLARDSDDDDVDSVDMFGKSSGSDDW
jgi:hypothetical protein